MPRVPRSLVRALQLVLTLAVLAFAGREVSRQWDRVGPLVASLRPRWSLLAASALVVLAAYALLIAVWRFMLRSWGDRLSARDAARIWFVSNLGRYVPGKVWQIGAMGVMARNRGVSPAAAVGSSLVINLVNLVSGFALVLITGGDVLGISSSDPALARRIAGVMVVLGLLAVALAPVALPVLARVAGRALGRRIELPRLPAAALWAAALGTFAAWALYGLAFRLFTLATLGTATGGTSAYLAVYTGSYLAGYLALVVPGGLGVRELVIVAGMQRLGLAGEPAATVVAWASRLWLTVLEILPGVAFLVVGGGGAAEPTTTDDVPS